MDNIKIKNSVPEGYKQTEIGIISEDWEIHTFGEILKIRHGKSQHDVLCEDGAFPILATSGEIGRANKPLYTKPSVLIGRKGTIDVPRYMDTPFWTVDTLFYSEIDNKADPKFIYYKFCLIDWYLYNEASGVPSLNAKTIEKISQAVPKSKIEQTTIATALSDADALIAALQNLIAKKRAIKTATMQQLLTGKKRLPGFKTVWRNINIGTHAILKARIGWQALTTNEYLEQGDFYLVTGTDFTDGRVNWSTCHYVNEWRYRQDCNIQLRNGDVLITKDGTIGKVGYIENMDKPATLNSGVFVIRPQKGAFYSLFLFYILSSSIFDSFLNKIAAGSTINHLYQKDFVLFELKAPADIKEQTAIANVLSDIDLEITALEQRLAKTQQLKQGMMQELLTGKTRLV